MLTAPMLVELLSGVLVLGYAAAGLFFLRFWRESKDRLFGYFAVAFFALAIQRILVAILEPTAMIYVVRLFAFLLIIWAVVEKNREQ